jgi:hypothetical protein
LTAPSWKEVLIVIAIQMIGIGVQIGVYYIVDKEFDPPATWSAMILLLCKEKPEHAYHHESLKAIGYTFGSFGAYWGMFL